MDINILDQAFSIDLLLGFVETYYKDAERKIRSVDAVFPYLNECCYLGDVEAELLYRQVRYTSMYEDVMTQMLKLGLIFEKRMTIYCIYFINNLLSQSASEKHSETTNVRTLYLHVLWFNHVRKENQGIIRLTDFSTFFSYHYCIGDSDVLRMFAQSKKS